jgi:hypothetical protein
VVEKKKFGSVEKYRQSSSSSSCHAKKGFRVSEQVEIFVNRSGEEKKTFHAADAVQ